MILRIHCNLNKVVIENLDIDKSTRNVLSTIQELVEDIFSLSDNEISGPTILHKENYYIDVEGKDKSTLGLTLEFHCTVHSRDDEKWSAIKRVYEYLKILTTDDKGFSFNIKYDDHIKNNQVFNTDKRFNTFVEEISIRYNFSNDNKNVETFNIDDLFDYIWSL